MNTTPLTTIAPEIFRKRLLVEGYFTTKVDEESLREYFSRITSDLGLRTYGDPIIHRTAGAGKDINEGLDGFVPLIDSGSILAFGRMRSFSQPSFILAANLTKLAPPALLQRFFSSPNFSRQFSKRGKFTFPNCKL